MCDQEEKINSGTRVSDYIKLLDPCIAACNKKIRNSHFDDPPKLQVHLMTHAKSGEFTKMIETVKNTCTHHISISLPNLNIIN